MVDPPRLVPHDAQAFRQWFVAIVEDQVLRRPSPRWQHRDCAGLVRFAAVEALRAHDEGWLRAMGWDRNRPRPPDLSLTTRQQALLREWQLPDGSRAAYAPAIAIVQRNCRLIGRQRNLAMPGDLICFDQGDDQHLMVWTGSRIAYHTGAEPDPGGTDNGLRHTTWATLMRHSDTRWRPAPDNPNFAGFHRFAFLPA